jgi:hypothetical protein
MRYRLSEVQAWVAAMEAHDHAADLVDGVLRSAAVAAWRSEHAATSAPSAPVMAPSGRKRDPRDGDGTIRKVTATAGTAK